MACASPCTTGGEPRLVKLPVPPLVGRRSLLIVVVAVSVIRVGGDGVVTDVSI